MHRPPPSLRRALRARALAPAVAACIALAVACAGPTAEAPPERAARHLPQITAGIDEPLRPGKFVWLDLVTPDVAAAKRFYGELLGWRFEQGDRYTEIFHEGRPMAGIVAAEDPQRGSEWVGNLSVRDVDAAAAAAREQGGLVEQGPVDAPERGRMALVSDPEHALVLLLRSQHGDPPDREPAVGDWFWQELWTHDVEGAAAFYSALADYEVREVDLDGLGYRVLVHEGVPRAGIVEAPPGVHPLWLPYVRVDDPARIADAAQALGARIVMQHERSAILVDPTGAPFAVQVVGTPQRTGQQR